MCGIFGRIGPGPQLNFDSVNQAHKALNHRGPDDRGYEKGDGFDFGFNRLSILDLSSSGHQPMWDQTGRYCIVFNGEIFNYRELREEHLGEVSWQGSSDTEVLLQLLIKKGKNAVSMLNGMFAFCYLDTQTMDFIIARDRFGIKPLYYTIWNQNLYFASELKALTAICPRGYELCESALFDYLGSGYISGGLSIYDKVYKFPAAQFSRGNTNAPYPLKFETYWTVEISEDYSGTFSDALEELDLLLQNAVSIRLRSDVPLGIFLSGGIDSGLVAAIAAQELKVNCYTISFPGAANDESELAKLTADHIGAFWHTLEMKELDASSLSDLAYFYDEPFADSSAIPSFEVSKRGREKGIVYLTGDAGDEAFAGYARYIERLKYDRLMKLLRPFKLFKNLLESVLPGMTHLINKILGDGNLRDVFFDDYPVTHFHKKILNEKTWKKLNSHFSKLSQNIKEYSNVTIKQQTSDYQRYLPDDILIKMDRASMGNSIEVRSPFLDYRVHEFAASLPREWLINESSGKLLLKELAKRYLPEKVFTAPKKGFGIPVDDWMSDEKVLNHFKTLISESNLVPIYFSKKELLLLVERHKKKKSNKGSYIHRIYMLLLWEEKYGSQIECKTS